jgi:predicted  nucleic acid-binding Zn-ribbon protein
LAAAAKVPGLEDKLAKLEGAAQEAKLKEELWRNKLEKVRDRYEALEADRGHWHQREQELGKQFIELEDQLHQSTNEIGRLKAKAPATFAVVMVEFTVSVVSSQTCSG